MGATVTGSSRTQADLAFALASQIAKNADCDGFNVGVLGGSGSGRSTFCRSLCRQVVLDSSQSWLVAQFRPPIQARRSCVLPALFQSLLTAQHIDSANSQGANSLVFLHSGVCARLLLLFRFSLATQKAGWFFLLFAFAFLSCLLLWVAPGAITQFSAGQITLAETVGLYGLALLLVLMAGQCKKLLVISDSDVSLSHLNELCRLRLNPLWGHRRRMILVADEFHAVEGLALPPILHSLHALPESVTVIYALDADVTLAAFAGLYKELNGGQLYVDVQQQARAQLARLVDVSVNLDLLDATQHHYPGQLPFQPDAGEVAEIRQRFDKWVAYFGFKNPRQQKRLLATYRVLQALIDEDGALSKGNNPTLDHLTADISCPMLIALCALEYINSLSDPHLRTALLCWIERYRQRTFHDETETALSDMDSAGRLTEDIIAVAIRAPRATAESGSDYARLVAAFVLPALQVHAQRLQAAADLCVSPPSTPHKRDLSASGLINPGSRGRHPGST